MKNKNHNSPFPPLILRGGAEANSRCFKQQGIIAKWKLRGILQINAFIIIIRQLLSIHYSGFSINRGRYEEKRIFIHTEERKS